MSFPYVPVATWSAAEWHGSKWVTTRICQHTPCQGGCYSHGHQSHSYNQSFDCLTTLQQDSWPFDYTGFQDLDDWLQLISATYHWLSARLRFDCIEQIAAAFEFPLCTEFRTLNALRLTREMHTRVCYSVLACGKFESIHVLMSAEPARKKAYSIDLQWRVVYQRIGMALPFYKIAKNLNIATSTAHRIYNKFANSGDVQSMERRCRPELRSLDEHSELVILV